MDGALGNGGGSRNDRLLADFGPPPCGQVQETVFANVDTNVLERIAKIMSYIKTSKDGRKMKKKDRDEILGILAGSAGPTATAAAAAAAAPAASPAAPAAQGSGAAARAAAKPADADDIFGDAGSDYKPVVPDRPKAAKQRAKDMDVEEGQLPMPPPRPPMPQHQGGAAQQQSSRHAGMGYPPPPPPPSGMLPHPPMPGVYGGGGMMSHGYGYEAQHYYGQAATVMQGQMDPEQYEEFIRAQAAYQVGGQGGGVGERRWEQQVCGV